MMTIDISQDTGTADVDCMADADAGLKTMFVDLIQQRRIDAGQCPALRPVFHKIHGAVRGNLSVRADADPKLRTGIFARDCWPIWLRFSSDTPPESASFQTTIGVGMKLFGVSGEKLVGEPDAHTFDMIFQNHDVFFVDTASDMCRFTRAVLEGTSDQYLVAHPETAAILDEMAKPEPSVLAATYRTILPLAFGTSHAKFALVPHLTLPPLCGPPTDPDFLAADLVARLAAGPAHFTLSVQLRTDREAMPLDKATIRWDEATSPFLPLADLEIPAQDIQAPGQAEFGENLAFNIWRVTADHEPAGTIARARRTVYAAAASLRRKTNGVPDTEPKEP